MTCARFWVKKKLLRLNFKKKFLLKGNTLKTYTHFSKLIMIILGKRRFSFCFAFLRLENKDVFVKCDYFVHYVEICSGINIVILILGFKKRRKKRT